MKVVSYDPSDTAEASGFQDPWSEKKSQQTWHQEREANAQRRRMLKLWEFLWKMEYENRNRSVKCCSWNSVGDESKSVNCKPFLPNIIWSILVRPRFINFHFIRLKIQLITWKLWSFNSSTARGVKSGVNRALLEFLLWHFDGDDLLNVHVLAQGLHGLEKTSPPQLGDETVVMSSCDTVTASAGVMVLLFALEVKAWIIAMSDSKPSGTDERVQTLASGANVTMVSCIMF